MSVAQINVKAKGESGTLEDKDPVVADIDVALSRSAAVEDTVPLCVDLDGTLIKTDLLLESVLKLIKQNPLYLLALMFWLIKGKPTLKAEVAKRVDINVALLPYNEELLAYLKAQSRTLVLVTGSHSKYAHKVAEHLNIFSDVFASNEHYNLTRLAKRKSLVDKYGESGFDYIGNDRDDWKVWPAAREVLVVSHENAYLKSTRNQFKVSKEFILPKVTIRDFIKSIRVHQWVKNVLIFIPFLLEHQIFNMIDIYMLVAAFFCMSLLASFTYIINDLLDLESDRQNDVKKLRAFASGLISIKQALQIMAVLFVSMVLLATQLPIGFIAVLVIYLLSTLSYSLFLKKVAILDVCILASLYTLRVIAGGVVINAAWSFWLLAFSMFFFMSLAIAKRVSELENIKRNNKVAASSRGYLVLDMPMLMSTGISAGLVSILVVALYINGSKVQSMYASPEILWLICPLLMYWIGRVWMVTARGEMHEDPILFAVRDRNSILTAMFAGFVILGALFIPSFIHAYV